MNNIQFILSILLGIGGGIVAVFILQKIFRAGGATFDAVISVGPKIWKIWRERKLEREREKQRSKEQAEEKRRQDARAACELLYNLHEHAIKDRLPKAVVQDFISRNMADSFPADYVEQRAMQLQQLISSHVEQVESPTKKADADAERAAAQNGARRFYDDHAAWLAAYPRVLLEAFIRKEMSPDKSPDHCWEACHQLIGELLQFIAEEKAKQHKKEPRKAVNPPLENI